MKGNEYSKQWAENPCRYRPFIRRDFFNSCIDHLRQPPETVDPIHAAVVNGVLAVGCDIVEWGIPQPAMGEWSKGNLQQGRKYFQAALCHRNVLTEGRPSMIKIQVRPQGLPRSDAL